MKCYDGGKKISVINLKGHKTLTAYQQGAENHQQY
jgi:hypothetical protein